MRTLHVYPKATIDGALWTLTMKVSEHATDTRSEFIEEVAAGVTAERPLRLLKVVWDLIVADADTDLDVKGSLFDDDIQPGPQKETVWGNWQSRAEGILSGLATGYTEVDFWAAWTTGDTQGVRLDAQRAMVSGPVGGRGWTIVAGSVHQHEDDRAVTNE